MGAMKTMYSLPGTLATLNRGNGMTFMRDRLREFHIHTGVLDACSRNGIPHDSPLRAELEADATVEVGDSSHVIMKNGNSLDVEIRNRIRDRAGPPSPAASPATGSRTVANGDTDSVQKHFADIAAGTVRVE
jgi:hypothetical protein